MGVKKRMNSDDNIKDAIIVDTISKPRQVKQVGEKNVYAKRVGTISVGITLIATGVIMFLSVVYPSINYINLFKFAPLLLCLLGVEILLSFSFCKKINLKYDYAGIFLALVTVLGAFLLSSIYVYHMLNYSFY